MRKPKKSLKFLADESLEFRIVKYLRSLGYDVSSIAEIYPTISDSKVLMHAISESRIVITNDKDFGDLVFLNRLPHKGIILLRLKSDKIDSKIKFLDNLLKKYLNQLTNHFVVLEENKIRIR